MTMRVALLSSLLATVMAASLPVSPVAAQTGDGWTSIDGEDRCDIRFYEGGAMVFGLSAFGNNGYSLSGSAFRTSETGKSVRGRIRALVGDTEVLLAGDEGALREQTRDTRRLPVGLFLTSVEGASGFTVSTEAGEHAIPLAGFDPAAARFKECARGIGRTDGTLAPELIAFEGMDHLRVEASRQGLLSEVLGFTLTVDPEGKATDCTISRHFRRQATRIGLCRPFLRHTTFNPAVNAAGEAVEGTYYIEINFNMFIATRGYYKDQQE